MQPPAADGEVMASGPALLSHERGRLGPCTAGSAQLCRALTSPVYPHGINLLHSNVLEAPVHYRDSWTSARGPTSNDL